MKKNVALIAVIIIFIAVLAVGLWFWSSKSNKATENKEATPVTSDIILFYGKTCPHCVEVEKFLKDNNVAENVKFDSLEVWYNKKNSALFQEKALECNLKKEELGVPLLYSKGQCLIGAPNIENFFQDKVNGQ